jgi:hypothetical protein
MLLDVRDAGLTQNGAGGAPPRYLDAQRLKFDLIVKVLQRNDPLRRSYLQRRWRGHQTALPLCGRRGALISNPRPCPQLRPVADRPRLRVTLWQAMYGD